MSAGFFRKSALEKLSTPEKLDQLIKVTGSKGWIALTTIALALMTALGWAFTGKVKTKLNVNGVLLGGEVHEVVSTSQGQLVELMVGIGDKVKKGESIAEVLQPQLLQQIDDAKAILQERKFELSQLASFGNKDANIQSEWIDQTRTSIQVQIETERKNINYWSSQLKTEQQLLSKGLITKSQLAMTQQQLDGSKNNLEKLKSQMVQTSSQQLNIGFDYEQKINIQNQRIAQAERNLTYLEDQYELMSHIKSPYSGEVVEVLTDKGVVVNHGSPLFKLKNSSQVLVDNKVKGILYIPSQDGKKIKEGMEALVVPSTVQPQEFGFIKGKVTYVSDFPITQKGMMTTVKNDQLVGSLLRMGALFEVFVEFEEDPESFSGYRWTSAKGPDIAVREGTSCMGKITIREEPPVAIVIPAVKKFFDLY